MGALISDFDYRLPEELIAQEALTRRDSSRLLVIDRSENRIVHGKHFYSLPEFLKKGDVLVLNDTRVIPCRLEGRKKETGGRTEFLLLRRFSKNAWEILARPSRRLCKGAVVEFGENLTGRLLSSMGEGRWTAEFEFRGDFFEILRETGSTPLPPYIRKSFDRNEISERYQTIYADKPGAAAAPTAGLHFTGELLGNIKKSGVALAFITVHAGAETFRPVKSETVEGHRMSAEYYEIGGEAAGIINGRPEGGRVFAVGTTSARVLETAASAGGGVRDGSGWTGIYIYPGYRFRCVQALITNFHQPRSTNILLVSAFAGRELLLRAYREAVAEKYRFLSFGDANLIL